MLALVNDLVEPPAQTIDRHPITDPEEDSPDLRGALIGPVLERLFDEAAQRYDHPPQIPQPDHHISTGDRFDRAGLALDDHLVIDPYRLGHRDLDPGEQVAQHGPGSEPHHQARSPG